MYWALVIFYLVGNDPEIKQHLHPVAFEDETACHIYVEQHAKPLLVGLAIKHKDNVLVTEAQCITADQYHNMIKEEYRLRQERIRKENEKGA